MRVSVARLLPLRNLRRDRVMLRGWVAYLCSRSSPRRQKIVLVRMAPVSGVGVVKRRMVRALAQKRVVVMPIHPW